MNLKEQLDQAKSLVDSGRVDESFEILEEVLTENPNNGIALALGAYISEKANRFPMGYLFAKRATEVSPERAVGWELLGKLCDILGLFDESERAYRKAIQLSMTSETKGGNYANLAALYINSGRFKDAKAPCEAALKLTPNTHKARGNYGLCLLGLKDWSGWDYYSALWGTIHRPKKKWINEPDWNGEAGKKVIVYTEQGLGDEICFSSMVNDISKDCEVVLECDLRLANLFERSFPGVKVYGTRWKKHVFWDEEDRRPDFSISLGELGRFYRKEDKDFPKEPYLKADPNRKMMWRALFDSKKKPVIGIAWTGGTVRTNSKYRKLTLENLKPIFSAVDAHFVSLEYKNAFEEVEQAKKIGIDIEQYPFGTLTPDYDDTAALVDECDLIICMQTAVAHLAGGLGKDCFVMVPKTSGWRYGEEGDKTIWYPSLTLFREEKGWGNTINKVAKAVNDRFQIRRAA